MRVAIMIRRLAGCACVLVLFGGRAGGADVSLRVPHVFGDRMVIQSGREIPVWGWAEPGTEISVSFAGS
jgi:sialate O-acetylesterase